MTLDDLIKALAKHTVFETTRGVMSIEDLFDLPLKSNGVCLNSVAVSLDHAIKDLPETDFVGNSTETSNLKSDLSLRLDIVKAVIEYKKNEFAAKQKKADQDYIRMIINKKKSSELEEKSIEELEKML